MLLLADNRVLVKDREKTYLTAASSASSSADQVLTVKAVDSNAWADDDYVIVGEIGSKNAELMRISQAVSDGTSFQVSRSTTSGADTNGLRYDHSINEPVYRIDFNQVEFNRTATDTTVGTAVLDTVEIQPDDIFTRYEDTSNTTGFAFVRFNNEETSAFSAYSDGIPYAGQDAKSLAKLQSKVRTLIDEPEIDFIDDDAITACLNDRQRDIMHERFWSFNEVERTLSAVADQFAYDIDSELKDATVHTVLFDTEPLAKIGRARWDMLHWDTDTSTSDPTHVNVFGKQLKIYPRPSGSAGTTAINDATDITATDTSVTVDSTSSFNRGDYYRFIIDSEVIYATAATTTSFTGLLRGREGTTAAAHLDDATITERDIVYTGQREPTDLVDLNDETRIPEPLILAYGAASDLALKQDRQVLHDRLLAKYEEGMKTLRERYTIKHTGYFTRVRDPREVVSDFGEIRNPNDFPQNVG